MHFLPFLSLNSKTYIKNNLLLQKLHLTFYFKLFIITFHFFLEYLNNTFETTLSCTLVVAWNYYVDYQTTQTEPRTNVTSKMEIFVTIFYSFHSLTIFTKISILDVAGILDPTIITDIVASRSQFLINLKSIFPLYRNRSISSNDKKDGWLLWDGNVLISNSLRKQMCTEQSVKVYLNHMSMIKLIRDKFQLSCKNKSIKYFF